MTDRKAMHRWTEVRTAYCVATHGTVTAAATALGVHRATVLRHIDALEEVLGAKLFQRHARGYTPTEAGRELVRVAKATEEQIEDLVGRTRARHAEVSGELVVTTVEIATGLLLRALERFRLAHPQATVRIDVSERRYELAYGEAHVAIRAGERPRQADNVVRPCFTLRNGLYAHADYIARRGRPSDESEFAAHDFISSRADSEVILFRWLHEVVPAERIVFRCTNQRVLSRAVRNAMGIGFMPEHEARQYPELEEIVAPREAWDVPFWLVTHVDLHRSAKVQAFCEAMDETLAELEPRSSKRPRTTS